MFIKYITGPMFSCRDITQHICKRLEARDVFNLMRAGKKAYEMISSLLVGSVVGKREVRGDTDVMVHVIPLLNISESVPVGIASGSVFYNITRVLRLRELRDEVVLLASPSNEYRQICVYVIDDYVRHCISFMLGRLSSVSSIPRAYKLGDLENVLRLLGTYKCVNVQLTRTVKMCLPFDDKKSTSSALGNRVRLRCNIHILTSERFLRFIAGATE